VTQNLSISSVLPSLDPLGSILIINHINRDRHSFNKLLVHLFFAGVWSLKELTMSMQMWLYAALSGVALAWTNPSFIVGRNSAAVTRAPSLSAATLSATDSSTTAYGGDSRDSLTTHLCDEGIMTLLQTVPSSSSACLEEMTSIFLDSETHPPGTLSWDVLDTSYTVLNAWRKTARNLGAETAHNILKRLLLEEECTNKQLVNMKHYGMVVEGYSKADNPQAAEQVLGEMKEAPDRILLNSIMTAWARQGNAEQAMKVFQRIPSPTTKDYNSLLSAHAKCGNAREAEALLRYMVTSKHENVHPDIVSYNCLLNSWSKSGEKGAADRALSIMSSLPKPDAFTYSCVINAYIKEGNINKVHDLLEQVDSQGIKMDSHLQNALLLAYATEGNAERAEELLDDMECEGTVDAKSYSAVIKAWKESSATDKAQRAEDILDRMVTRGLQDVVSYTSVVSLNHI